jgi:hypothetical protein
MQRMHSLQVVLWAKVDGLSTQALCSMGREVTAASALFVSVCLEYRICIARGKYKL